MVDSRGSLYARWRLSSGVVPILKEDDPLPPELLLQAVWFHQRLRRDELETTDGRAVRVLHPGFWNHEAGPDFRGAMIQLGGGEVMAGDVEVDVDARNWFGHGHDRNPGFGKVVLHVIWDGPERTRLPTVRLKPHLDSALGDLAFWLGGEQARGFPEGLRGPCSAPLAELPRERLEEVLREAALIRFHAKAGRIQARARQAGWEQALWEGLFRGLGYKQNIWPMQRLAELRSRICPGPGVLPPQALQARLLGVGGLLPGDLVSVRSGRDAYLREVWGYWWRDRDGLDDCLFPPGLWRFHALRPANHPARRLALATHWLSEGRLTGRLEGWCGGKPGEREMVGTLLEAMRVGVDSFWSWHWTLGSGRLEKPQPLLGATRLTDLAVNVVLPWLWARAADGNNTSLMQELERRYFTWPSAQDNAVLRLARERLLGGRGGVLATASMQQGLLQIVRDFCDHSNSLCSTCRFPGLIRGWGMESS